MYGVCVRAPSFVGSRGSQGSMEHGVSHMRETREATVFSGILFMNLTYQYEVVRLCARAPADPRANATATPHHAPRPARRT